VSERRERIGEDDERELLQEPRERYEGARGIRDILEEEKLPDAMTTSG
jgi:hypothetical protein